MRDKLQQDGFILAAIWLHLWWAGMIVIAPTFLLHYHSSLRGMQAVGPLPIWAVLLLACSLLALYAVLSPPTPLAIVAMIPQQTLLLYLLFEQHRIWVAEGASLATVVLIMPVTTLLTVGHTIRVFIRGQELHDLRIWRRNATLQT